MENDSYVFNRLREKYHEDPLYFQTVLWGYWEFRKKGSEKQYCEEALLQWINNNDERQRFHEKLLRNEISLPWLSNK